MTHRRFATALPLLLLAASLSALPLPAAAKVTGKTELDKLVGRVQGTRGWDESPTRELGDYLLKAPAR